MIKEINRHDIKVQWYRESYITSTKAFVSADINGIKENVLICNDGLITAITLKNDTVDIKLYGHSNDIYTYKSAIGQLKVKIDTNVSFDTWNRFYHPEQFDKNGYHSN